MLVCIDGRGCDTVVMVLGAYITPSEKRGRRT